MTVIDTDAERLSALAHRYDVRTVEGNGTTKRVMREAGVEEADLLIACSPREDANLVSAMLARKLSRAGDRAHQQPRVSGGVARAGDRRRLHGLLGAGDRERDPGLIGIPAARQTDVFADGKVQIVEFDVPKDTVPGPVIDRSLREAEIPKDSKVVAIVRGNELLLPRGGERSSRATGSSSSAHRRRPAYGAA